MTCARGCCDTQAEHYRSLMVARSDRRSLTKVTTDVHDHHKVSVRERWDGQDVKVKPEAIRVSGERNADGSISIHPD